MKHVQTRTLANGEVWHYVTFSPRGFYNEVSTSAFMEADNAEDFAREVDNEVGSWVETGPRAAEHADDYAAHPAATLAIWSRDEMYQG